MIKYTFGIIASRRFGLSLGIDVNPTTKQCNFDCLYCELEPAKAIDNISISNLVSPKTIIDQVQKEIKINPNIDVLTVTSNGEPTLYPYLDELIDELNLIKANSKTLILSNASKINEKKIRDALCKFDIVKLSLDCISKECFKKLDRHHNSIDIDEIIDGIIKFSKIHDNLILEILFVKSLNDSEDEITKLIDTIKQINPSRVDLGTIDRPPAYDVKPVSYEFLDSVAKKFNSNQIDNISIAHRDMKTPQNLSYSKEDMLELLKMRPLTNSDIEYLFDDKSKAIFNKLLENNQVKKIDASNSEFFSSVITS
jgi:wyosine [tRNA(Phe)-imidazoG37] synthetase (radical SAM superfamily)